MLDKIGSTVGVDVPAMELVCDGAEPWLDVDHTSRTRARVAQRAASASTALQSRRKIGCEKIRIRM